MKAQFSSLIEMAKSDFSKYVFTRGPYWDDPPNRHPVVPVVRTSVLFSFSALTRPIYWFESRPMHLSLEHI